NATGGAVYSTLLGFGQGGGIAVSSAGVAIISGVAFYPAHFPTTPGAFQTTPGIGDDAFLTLLDSSGSSLLYSTFLGGNNHDDGSNRVAADGAGNVYVSVSHTTSDDLPVTPGALQSALGGNLDGYVAKFDLSSVLSSGNSSQTVKLFAVPEHSVQIYRFEVDSADSAPVLDDTFSDASLQNPVGLAFSPAGELFVTNRGPNSGQGGSITRFLNPTGTPVPHGVINSPDFYAPHWAAFRGNELFAAEGTANTVLRFVFDTAGNASRQGTISDGLVGTAPRGVALAPWGEVFVSQCCSVDVISRYLVDSNGNAVPNGTISGGGLSSPHDLAFSPQGELFVANPVNNSVSRFKFDAQHNVTSSAQLTSPTFSVPIGLAFSPWGELFVCNYANTTVSRFTFDGSSNAVPNGTFSAPAPLADIAFASGTSPTATPTPTPSPTPSPAPSGTFIVNSTGDGADSNIADGVCDDGTSHCTLRAAIQQANATAGANTIAFNIPGGSAHTITPTSPLPQVTDPVMIDGTTQPGFAGTPVISLVGAGAGSSHGLHFVTGNSRVRGLSITRFQGDGIVFQHGSHNIVEGNFIGVDATSETAAAGNGSDGVYAENSTDVLIGGVGAGARNIIAGNGRFGVYCLAGSSGTQIVNNYFGTDATGTTKLPNGSHTIYLENSGGANVNGNVVSNSGAGGIVLLNSPSTAIHANRVGLDAAGTAAMPNGGDGVFVQNSPNVVIGSAHPNDRNIIANSGRFGIYILDGSTGAKVQGNYVGTDATGADAMPNGSHGVYLENSGAALVTSNVVANCRAGGVVLLNAADSVVKANLVGLSADGATAMPNGGDGVFVQRSPNVVVGSMHPNDRNVIANSGRFGVYILDGSSGVKVEGNRIGTDAAGAARMPNGSHDLLFENSGGASIGSNLLSNSGAAGLVLVGSGGSNVYGNFIGTDAAGTAAMPNGGDGVFVQNSPDVTIGSAHPNDRNVVANSGHHGIYVLDGSARTKVQGNFVGTDAAGATKMSSGVEGIRVDNTDAASVLSNVVANSGEVGVLLFGASNAVVKGNLVGLGVDGTTPMRSALDGVLVITSPHALIGGPTASERNVVANSGRHGVYVLSNSTGARVDGNLVGTDASGMVAMPSAVEGVRVDDTDAVSISGNVVANSGEVGLLLFGASNAVVEGNLVGVGANGTTPMGSVLDGILITNSPNTRIGGNTPEARNVIAANRRHGIWILGGTTGVRVQGNSIGTDASGAANLGNTQAGVFINESASNNSIGGVEVGAGNRIAHNGGDGILVGDGVGTSVLGNSIYANGGLGIDLGPDGVTPNDALDADGGPNRLQNFPVITSVNGSGGTTTVSGTLDSASGAQYRVELFANAELDPSGHGEGQTFLASTDVTTDASGHASFSVGVPASASTLISATATDSSGNTSEFSNADAEAPTLNLPSDIVADATGPDGAAVNFTATATDNSGQRVVVTCAPDSGSTFHAGTTVVRCSATDASGNTASGSFLVTVGGGAPPPLPSNYAYVTTNSRPTQVAGLAADRIDTSDAPVTDLPINGNPGAMVVAPDGARAYILSHAANTISVVETSTNAVVSTINTPAQPSGLAISPDNKRLYLITQSDNTVRAIDLETHQTVATYPTGTGPLSVAVSPDGARLYVANYGSNNVSVINTTDGTSST
ncbi:MAG: hypothetical protein QOC61_171, partial [Acidobacteriota bacterium]|nr:hypothetical protein [Acidobacteriota bacterium]